MLELMFLKAQILIISISVRLSLLLLSQNLFDDVAIHSVKGNDYRIHFWNMSKAEAVSRMK